jgi:hypothetical protein
MSESKDAIRRLMNEYCHTVDRADMDGFAALFARGSFEIEGDPNGPMVGAEAVRAMLDNVTLYDGQTLAKHVMSNVQIEVNEAGDSATAQCYLTVFQCVPPDFPLQAIFMGHYHDRFQRDADGWYFSHRLISSMLVGDLSRHRADMA